MFIGSLFKSCTSIVSFPAPYFGADDEVLWNQGPVTSFHMNTPYSLARQLPPYQVSELLRRTPTYALSLSLP